MYDIIKKSIQQDGDTQWEIEKSKYGAINICYMRIYCYMQEKSKYAICAWHAAHIGRWRHPTVTSIRFQYSRKVEYNNHYLIITNKTQ